MTRFGFVIIFISEILRVVFSECDVSPKPEGDSYQFGTYLYNGTFSDCHCGSTTICVRKCCHFGYVMINKTCVRDSLKVFKIDVFDDTTLVSEELNYRYLPGQMICKNGLTYYQLEPNDYPEDQFYMQRDGRLWQPAISKHIDLGDYCLDDFDDIGQSAIACFENNDENEKALNTLGMMISMPFLLATFIAYALLPERNLHGKSLMSYVMSLFIAYMFLVVMQEHTYVVGPGCTTLGTICLFFFMVSFLWMNVMSVDIWWTFKGIRGFSGNKKQVEHKKFLLYSAYTWGAPLVFIAIVTTINLTAPMNAWYKPGIGDGQCWITLGMPTLVYFYGPLTVIIVINIVLFARTAWRIRQIREDTAILRHSENRTNSDQNDKQRFYLYLKLFMAMGVNWSMEIISWLVDWQVETVHPAVWILTDLFNALYGVFIFFIFVFKRPIWNLLRKRYYLVVGKVQMAKTIRASDSPSTSITPISLCQRTTLR